MRAVVTVTGIDRRGVVAAVSSFLAEKRVNIEEITQTILGGRFAMMMVVDTSEIQEEFSLLAVEAAALGDRIEMNIRLQHADIFEAMHTV